MTNNWAKAMVDLSSLEIGWHQENPDAMDHYFQEIPPAKVLLELNEFFGKTVKNLSNSSDVEINDVYAFIQGPNGPLHFVKDERVDDVLVEETFRRMSSPFKCHFSSDSYVWTSGITWWDSFITYSNPFVADTGWTSRASLVLKMKKSARDISTICKTGSIAFEMAKKKYPGLVL